MLLLIVNAIYKDNGRCTLSKRDMDMGCMMACIGEFQIRNIDGFSFVDSDRKGRGGQNRIKKKKKLRGNRRRYGRCTQHIHTST